MKMVNYMLWYYCQVHILQYTSVRKACAKTATDLPKNPQWNLLNKQIMLYLDNPNPKI